MKSCFSYVFSKFLKRIFRISRNLGVNELLVQHRKAFKYKSSRKILHIDRSKTFNSLINIFCLRKGLWKTCMHCIDKLESVPSMDVLPELCHTLYPFRVIARYMNLQLIPMFRRRVNIFEAVFPAWCIATIAIQFSRTLHFIATRLQITRLHL